jgi:hypothetical protein
MKKSLIKITCTHCENSFPGVLNHLFDVSKTYAAECPSCSAQTFFIGESAFVDVEIPDDAVAIKYVATL